MDRAACGDRPERRRASAMFGLALLGVIAATGCAKRSTPDAEGRVLRLVDLVGTATVEGPLRRVAAVRHVAELDEVDHEVLLEEDFERFDPAVAGWPADHGAALVAGEHGRALHLRSHPLDGVLEWNMRAEPDTRYRLGRLVRAEGPPPVDLAVVELASIGEGRQELSPIKVNRIADGGGEGWRPGTVDFTTGSNTRVLEIRLVPVDGVETSAQALDLCFDGIRLERLRFSPDQEIALLKGKDPAPGADPALGLAKRGRFPPAFTATRAHAAGHRSFSYRDALYAPPPTTLVFPVDVPPRAALRFGTCLARETAPGCRARFEVLARVEGREELVWSRSLRAGKDEWTWHEHRVDLSPWAGREVEIVLRTHAERGNPHPMWGSPVIDTPSPEGALPSVILIAVDTLRADRLGCYGHGRGTSPGIDALAADGVRFENVASASTWTCPAFASIFTGLTPSRHGVFDVGMELPHDWPTLAERFREHGWSTRGIAYKAPLFDGSFDRGFDEYFNVPGVMPRADNNLVEVLDWLETSAGRRSFLFVHFDDPHQPFNQPEPWDRAFGDPPEAYGLVPGRRDPFDSHLKEPVSHAWPPTEAGREVVRDLYDGEIAFVDEQIGRFLQGLRERGLYDDSVIAFVSDHGEELWEHGRFGHGHDRMGDEVVRVPLIVKPRAGTFETGLVVATQVRNHDLMPTLLELAGIPVGDGLDAESLVPLMQGAEASDRFAISEVRGALCLRTTDWKYVLRTGRLGNQGRSQETLFHLREDPREQHDLGDERQDVLARMRMQVLEYLLLNRAGRYVVVVGEDEPGLRTHRILGAGRAGSFFGLQAQTEGDEAVLAGHVDGPLTTVTRIEGDRPVFLDGSRRPLAFVPYVAGTLERLLREGRVGAHGFENPTGSRTPRGETIPADLELLEHLHAVGYVGGQPEDGGNVLEPARGE